MNTRTAYIRKHTYTLTQLDEFFFFAWLNCPNLRELRLERCGIG
jgi:hypothetical protein